MEPSKPFAYALYQLIGVPHRSQHTTYCVGHDHDDQKEVELPHRTGSPPFDAFDGVSSKEEVTLGRLDWYSQLLGFGETRHVVDLMSNLPQWMGMWRYPGGDAME
jgi:hypothetical protein